MPPLSPPSPGGGQLTANIAIVLFVVTMPFWRCNVVPEACAVSSTVSPPFLVTTKVSRREPMSPMPPPSPAT
jgi:hypothetical protein